MFDADAVEVPCSIPAIEEHVQNLKNVRAFGLMLGITQGTLDTIYRTYSSDSLISRVVTEWYKKHSGSTSKDLWHKLHHVLVQPAIGEYSVANKLPCLSPHSSPHSCESVEENSEIGILQKGLNLIEPHSNWYQIGQKLHIPESELKEIKEHPIVDQKAHFVEALYRNNVELSPQILKQFKPPACNEDDVEEMMKELQSNFSKIQQEVMQTLEEKGIPFEKFKRAIASFDDQAAERSYELLTTASSENFCAIFRHWNNKKVWNFLDFDLLERLVRQYGLNETKVLMRQYSKEMKDFQKKVTVRSLMKLQRGYGDHYEEFKSCKQMIHDLDWPYDCTLEELKELRIVSEEELLRNAPLFVVAFALYRVNPGSVLVTWVVRTDLVPIIREALVECIIKGKYFHQNKIISLELDGETFMSMEQVG